MWITVYIFDIFTLHWRLNEHHDVSNRRYFDFLRIHLFRRTSKKLKAPRHWPLWGESNGKLWIPLTKSQYRGKCFHSMTPLWYICKISHGDVITALSVTESFHPCQLQVIVESNSLHARGHNHGERCQQLHSWISRGQILAPEDAKSI